MSKNNIYTTKLIASLVKDGLLFQRCYTPNCPVQKPIWQGKPLILLLDYINKDRSDERIQNLRLLCPNCFEIERKRARKAKASKPK